MHLWLYSSKFSSNISQLYYNKPSQSRIFDFIPQKFSLRHIYIVVLLFNQWYQMFQHLKRCLKWAVTEFRRPDVPSCLLSSNGDLCYPHPWGLTDNSIIYSMLLPSELSLSLTIGYSVCGDPTQLLCLPWDQARPSPAVAPSLCCRPFAPPDLNT